MMTDTSEERKDKRPIVCGTDFSEAAREAAEVAAAMAKRLETKLLLVHVEEYHGIADVDPALFEGALSEKRAGIEREAARFRESGCEVEIKLVSGSIFDELVTAATEAKARTVVVGARGHGLARRLLVGSVAERTAETSPIPTLVVRPATRLGPWLQGEHPLKILVGDDLSAASSAALGWVNELRQIGPCEISVLHVDRPVDVAERLGYHAPLPATENPGEVQNFLERHLREHVAMHLRPEQVTLAVEPGGVHPEEHLFATAKREEADLIVVGTHRRHGWSLLRFGSVSRNVLRHADVSVAVVPPLESRLPASVPELGRVLVATDFSELGNNAVPYGCAILQRGGILKLLHVLEPPRAAVKSQPHPGKDNPKLRVQLRSLVPTQAAARFKIETEILENADAAEAIRRAAERFDADVICLGSHGRSGLAKTSLGSVAQAVMADNRRPILIVREETP
jgi:nucleotide-binding universal stress UspA family protein